MYHGDGPNKTLYALDAKTGRLLWTSGTTIGNGGVYASPLVYAVSYGGRSTRFA